MRKWFQIAAAALSLPLFLIGIFGCLPPFLLFGCLLLCVHNLLYAAGHLKTRAVLLFFQAAATVFFLLRPLISLCFGVSETAADDASTVFAYTAVYLSFACLFLGAWGMGRWLDRRDGKKDTRPPGCLTDDPRLSRVRRIALVLFFTGLLSTLIVEGDKLFLMAGKSYLLYYTEYTPRVPYLVQALSGFLRPGLCFYLAAMPRKRPCFFVLLLFVLSSAPMLFIGQRNLIVQYAVFSFLYYLLRDRMEKAKGETKWLGRTEKTALAVSVPAVLVALSVISVTRFGETAGSVNPLSAVVRLFYDQGITFDVLRVGFCTLPALLTGGFKGYTFGGVTDYFAHGTLAQKLFGAADLGAGNNLLKATQSHSLAHNLSYQALGEDYLRGRGLGSSYLLETYADFGYLGVAVYSVLLGALLLLLVRLLRGKSLLLRAIALCCLITLFFTPRAEALGFLMFLFTPHFWAAALLCLLPGYFARRRRTMKDAGGERS